MGTICEIVGCNSFQAKSGRICYIVYVLQDFHSSQQNAYGRQASQYFVDQMTYSDCCSCIGKTVTADIRYINGANAFLGIKSELNV